MGNEVHNYNFVEIIKTEPAAPAALSRNLKEAVFNEIMKELIEDFRKKASVIVREHTSRITFDHIETYRDIMRLRDELRIFVTIDNVTDEKVMK